MVECSQGQKTSSGDRKHIKSDRQRCYATTAAPAVAFHDLKTVSASIMLHQPKQPVLEPPKISAGDLVIVYEGYNAMKAVQVEPTMKFGTKFGHFPMKVGPAILQVWL